MPTRAMREGRRTARLTSSISERTAINGSFVDLWLSGEPHLGQKCVGVGMGSRQEGQLAPVTCQASDPIHLHVEWDHDGSNRAWGRPRRLTTYLPDFPISSFSTSTAFSICASRPA